MKKKLKILSIFLAVFLLAASPVFSQTIEELQNAVNSFSDAMAKSLPFNSTIGLNWSDAYIGQLLGVPPRFGVGMAVGATTLQLDAINDLLDVFDSVIDLPFNIGLPLPAYTVEARIGGIIIPFDIGLKFGYLNTSNSALFDFMPFDVDYMLIGADFRYPLINNRLIRLSAGVGFNHLRGGISTEIDIGNPSFTFQDLSNTTRTITMNNPDVGLSWQTNVVELKAQASFIHFIITPYVGAGVSYAWSRAGYRVDANITGNVAEFQQVLNQLGITNFDPANGFESIIENNDWNARLFGGISFNLAVIRLDLTVMYNLRDNAVGATLGTRFQL